MRRITLAVLSTLAALVLLFSYRTSLDQGAAAQPGDRAHVVTPAAAASASGTGQGPDPSQGGAAGGTPSTDSVPGSTSAPTTSGPATSGAKPTVVDGDSELTQYGPVQVEVTISDGRITEVTAIQYPTEQRRDQQISSFALPELRSAVLSAQSAKVDAVSGATYTSEGYLASLQSALDAVHFGS